MADNIITPSKKTLEEWEKVEPNCYILFEFDPNCHTAYELSIKIMNCCNDSIEKVNVLTDTDGIEIILRKPNIIDILDIIHKKEKIMEYQIIAKKI
jgi:hypothetical protein